ncbi:hypothetical protein TWF696_004070 [Orbilia brochopaga]|uniref:Uncharacterized protein n=1 Tax=Orbilia brochopaga TaxID=3140254 RepID=A0AAV9V889_9PEZI
MVTVKTLGNASLNYIIDIADVKCGDAFKVPKGKLVVVTTSPGTELLELQYEVDGKKAAVHFSRALIRQLNDKGKIGLTSSTVTRYILPATITPETMNPHTANTIDLSLYKPQGASQPPIPLTDTTVLTAAEWTMSVTPARAVYDLKVIGDISKSWIVRLIREYNFTDPPMYARSWIVDESKFAKQPADEDVQEPEEGEVRQGNYALPKVAPFAITLPETMAIGQAAGFRWWCLMTVDSPLVRIPPVPKQRPSGEDTEADANGSA